MSNGDYDMDDVELLVVGAGPAVATAAREAARAGFSTLVLEKDTHIGVKRVCAAGLRPGFCAEFDLPRSLVHCDTPRLALFDPTGREHEVHFGPGHTTTREELDAAMAEAARAQGAAVRTESLFRASRRDGVAHIVEFADLVAGERKFVRARAVFFAQGATAKLESDERFSDARWQQGLMTTLQHRVYLKASAKSIAYQTLELHYYPSRDGRMMVAWMFPKRDHLAIGLGVLGKMPGALLREELIAFEGRVRSRLYAAVEIERVKEEGHLLYGGWPRERFAHGGAFVGGTAAGLVDATNGEGIFEAAMSGRLVADALACAGGNVTLATQRYRVTMQERFVKRLRRRTALMQFLERRPARFGLLFEQLARSPGFALALLKERHERTWRDRAVLSWQSLQFALRAGGA